MSVHKFAHGLLKLSFLMWWLFRGIFLSCCASPVHERPAILNEDPLFHGLLQYGSPEIISKDGKLLDHPNSVRPGQEKDDSIVREAGAHILDSVNGVIEEAKEEKSVSLSDFSSDNHNSFLALMKRRISAAEKDNDSLVTILIGSGAAVVSLVILTSCCFCIDQRQRPIGVYRMPTVLIADADDAEDDTEGIPLESLSHLKNGKARGEAAPKVKMPHFNPPYSNLNYDSRKILYSQTGQSGYAHR